MQQTSVIVTVLPLTLLVGDRSTSQNRSSLSADTITVVIPDETYATGYKLRTQLYL